MVAPLQEAWITACRLHLEQVCTRTQPLCGLLRLQDLVCVHVSVPGAFDYAFPPVSGPAASGNSVKNWLCKACYDAMICGAAVDDPKLPDIDSSLLCLRSVPAESQSANLRGLLGEPPWFATSDRQQQGHHPARNVSVVQLPSTRCQTMSALRCAARLWSVDVKRPPSHPASAVSTFDSRSTEV